MKSALGECTPIEKEIGVDEAVMANLLCSFEIENAGNEATIAKLQKLVLSQQQRRK